MDIPYTVYVLCCADGTYYTGVAQDVTKRVREHNASGRGAKYTKSRRPVRLVYAEPASSRGAALKREYAIRHLTRAQKNALIIKNSIN